MSLKKERLPGASWPGIAVLWLRMAVPPRVELAQIPALVSSASPHKGTPCIAFFFQLHHVAQALYRLVLCLLDTS